MSTNQTTAGDTRNGWMNGRRDRGLQNIIAPHNHRAHGLVRSLIGQRPD